MLVHEFLLDKRTDLGVVELGPVPGGLPMDRVGVRGQLFLDIEGLGQTLELVQLEVARATRDVGVDDVEVHLLPALAQVLDEVERVVPGAVRELAEDLLEAGAVLLVVGVVGGQEEEVEGAGYVGVGVLLDPPGDALDGAVFGVAVGEGADSWGRNRNCWTHFTSGG